MNKSNRKSKIIITVALITILATSGLFLWTNFKTDTTSNIPSNSVNTESINLKDKDLEIGNSATQKGDITIVNGNLSIGGNSTINGNIEIENGNLTIGNSVTITGKIKILNGNVTIGSNGNFQDVEVDGNFVAINSNNFESLIVTGENELQIASNNTIRHNISNENGSVIIGNSNNIEKNIIAKTFEQGDNNTLLGSQIIGQ